MYSSQMKHLRPIAIILAMSVLTGLVVYWAVEAVYRIAQVQSWPPALTNLSPFIAIAAIWFLIGRPVKRRLERRAEHRRQCNTQVGERNLPQRTLTKTQWIWKVGVLYWGGWMFLVFVVPGPLIPHFTMGKPLTVHDYTGGVFTSAIFSFPAGAIFGWLMWRNAKRIRHSNV
jgi:hypothetical protein